MPRFSNCPVSKRVSRKSRRRGSRKSPRKSSKRSRRRGSRKSSRRSRRRGSRRRGSRKGRRSSVAKSFKVVKMVKSDGCSTSYRMGYRKASSHTHAAKNAVTRYCSLKRIYGICTLFVTIVETGTNITKTFKGKRYLTKSGDYVVKVTPARAPKPTGSCRKSSGRKRMFSRRSPRRVSPYGFARLRSRS